MFRPSAPCPRSKSILDEAPSSLFVRLLLHRCTAGRLVPPRPSRGPASCKISAVKGITLPLLQPLFVLLVLPSLVFMCPPSSTDQPVNLVPRFASPSNGLLLQPQVTQFRIVFTPKLNFIDCSPRPSATTVTAVILLGLCRAQRSRRLRPSTTL